MGELSSVRDVPALIVPIARPCFIFLPRRAPVFSFAVAAFGPKSGARFHVVTPSVMSSSVSSLPPEFQWLSPAYRPSAKEVDTYARIITAAEGDPPEMLARHRQEAELQLWIWRNETRQRAGRSRRLPPGQAAVA